MLVSHEVPLKILESSRQFNDYDYALVHLFKDYPDYYKFYKKSLKLHRSVILDNSLFELESMFNIDDFIYWIESLKPTQYIIPDSLEDYRVTVESANSFIKKFKCDYAQSIGVVQGKTYNELVSCYRELDSLGVDKIAISFDYSYYLELFPNEINIWFSWMKGRITLINNLLRDGIINKSKSHHLLGASLPQEFTYYSNSKYSFIESMDSSNPVVHGLLNIKYNDYGLDSKESIKLVDLFSSNISKSQYDNIIYNVSKFRDFI